MVDFAGNRYADCFERHFDLGFCIADACLNRERDLHCTLDRHQPPSRYAGGQEFSESGHDVERNNLPCILDCGHCRNTILGFARGRSIRGVPSIDWGNIKHVGELVAEPARWYDHKRSLYGAGGNQHVTDNPPNGGKLGGPFQSRANFDYAPAVAADVDQP